MATVEQITKDPRFAALSPEKKKKILSMAENAPAGLASTMRDVSGKAVSEALMRPGSFSRDLMTDPKTQAKAVPAMTGTAGALSGIPMGTTFGTVAGRQLSNAALRAYGMPEEIPSTSSQVLEGVLSVAGDLTAIPAINKARFGRQIGAAEKAAGVPPAQDIMTTPMALGQKTIGEFINEAVDSVKSSGLKGTPAYWKTIKDQVDRIYKLGKDQPLTVLDKGRLKWLSAMVQTGLNKSVPGRVGPAQSLARSQVVPNAIKKVYQSIPGVVKAGTGGGLAFELARRLAGGDRNAR